MSIGTLKHKRMNKIEIFRTICAAQHKVTVVLLAVGGKEM